MLCTKCAYRTQVLYNFRLKVQESDKKFRMMLENQMITSETEELDDKDSKDNNVQIDESVELNISDDRSIHNADFLENPKIEIDETISKSEQQYEYHIPRLLENGGDNKENNNNLQLNELFHNILQGINENEADGQIVKTDIPEEISKILASQDITIMYIPHDHESMIEPMSESIFVENTVSEQKQEEIENNTFISAINVLKLEQKEDISSNIHISNPMDSNLTKENKRCCESVDDEVQSKNEQLNNSNSNIEQSRTEDSDESDSDYFIDTKDNILGSVNDAIVRIKEVKQENGIEYQCTLCQQNYEELSCILLHTVDNHVSSTGPFFCMVCEKDCESHRELRAHVKTHSGQEPYSCFICSKGYTKKRYLKRHMMCHSDFPRHRCSKCGCRFKAKSELESHMKTHSVPYSCNQCPRVFNHKGNYKRHLVSHLDPQGLYLPKYPCKYCGKRFPNNRTLETHIRVHTGERPFKCQYCEKSFSQRGNLINHTRIHSNPRSYTCEVCGKSFNQRATLRDHGLLHTGEKPHVCNVCGRAFTVSAALRRHMFYHAEHKPFKCETCNMGFVGKYDLRRHMKVHENRSKEKRRRNTLSKSSDLVQQESEESVAIIEEPGTETIFIEQVFLPQNVAQIVVNQVESEKENEDALFNLHCYNSALIQYS
ncbi:uncharacterized protein [Anoplolepis gracilipes]